MAKMLLNQLKCFELGNLDTKRKRRHAIVYIVDGNTIKQQKEQLDFAMGPVKTYVSRSAIDYASWDTHSNQVQLRIDINIKYHIKEGKSRLRSWKKKWFILNFGQRYGRIEDNTNFGKTETMFIDKIRHYSIFVYLFFIQDVW